MNKQKNLESEALAIFGPVLANYFPKKSIDHVAIWTDDLWQNVTRAISEKDLIAIELGCKLIRIDKHLSFGKIIKSNLARALKKVVDDMNIEQRQTIIRVTAKLMRMEFAPRELEDYCRLVKKFPFTEYDKIFAELKVTNGKSLQLQNYLLDQRLGVSNIHGNKEEHVFSHSSISNDEGKLLTLIEHLAPLEWRKYQARYPEVWIQDHFERADHSGHPPFISFRFRNESEEVVEKLKRAIQNYRGKLPWIMVGHTRDGLPGTNWVILPTRSWEVRGIASNAGMNPAKYLARFDPEFGPIAYEDLEKLTLYMTKIFRA
jgi:hypothetical protein